MIPELDNDTDRDDMIGVLKAYALVVLLACLTVAAMIGAVLLY